MGVLAKEVPKPELKKICKRPVDDALATSLQDAPRILEVRTPSDWASRHCEEHHRKGFRVSVPTKTCVVYGPWSETEEEAEAHAALEACIVLHAQGVLDQDLLASRNETRSECVCEIMHAGVESGLGAKSCNNASQGDISTHLSGIDNESIAKLPDDAVTSTTEQRERRIPACLRFPEGALNDRLHLHVLEFFGDLLVSETSRSSSLIGLLLPAQLEMSCPIYPPGSRGIFRLRPLREGQIQLSQKQLEQAVSWSTGVMSLLNVPLASAADRIGLQVQTLSLNPATGEYRIREPSDSNGDSQDEPHCLAVPMSEQGDAIDWRFIAQTLEPLRTGQFPSLGAGLSKDGMCWTDKEKIVKVALGNLVVLGRSAQASQKKRNRCRFYTNLAPVDEGCPEIMPASPATSSKNNQLFRVVAVHRSFLLAGADAAARPALKDEVDIIRSHDCSVAPITAQIATAVMLLPTALWLAELRAGTTELWGELRALKPQVSVDDALLRIALTRAGVATCCNEDSEEGHLAAYGQDGERLEFLGDALLKLVSRAVAFLEFPEAGEGGLTTLANRCVTNAFLRGAAERLGLTRRLVACPFQRGKCLAELRQQEVAWKAPADVVEALIAVVYLSARCNERPGCGNAFEAVFHFFCQHLRRADTPATDVACAQAPESLPMT